MTTENVIMMADRYPVLDGIVITEFFKNQILDSGVVCPIPYEFSMLKDLRCQKYLAKTVANSLKALPLYQNKSPNPSKPVIEGLATDPASPLPGSYYSDLVGAEISTINTNNLGVPFDLGLNRAADNTLSDFDSVADAVVGNYPGIQNMEPLAHLASSMSKKDGNILSGFLKNFSLKPLTDNLKAVVECVPKSFMPTVNASKIIPNAIALGNASKIVEPLLAAAQKKLQEKDPATPVKDFIANRGLDFAEIAKYMKDDTLKIADMLRKPLKSNANSVGDLGTNFLTDKVMGAVGSGGLLSGIVGQLPMGGNFSLDSVGAVVNFGDFPKPSDTMTGLMDKVNTSTPALGMNKLKDKITKGLGRVEQKFGGTSGKQA